MTKTMTLANAIMDEVCRERKDLDYAARDRIEPLLTAALAEAERAGKLRVCNSVAEVLIPDDSKLAERFLHHFNTAALEATDD